MKANYVGRLATVSCSAVLVALLAPALPAEAQSVDDGFVTSWSPTDALARLSALGVPRLSGDVPVHCSSGFEERCRHLQNLLSEAQHFYEEVLHTRQPVEVAVLAEDDWVRLSPVPYGLPFPYMGTPNVVVLGATHDHEAVHDLISRRDFARAEDHARLQGAGVTWESASGQLLDLVAFHELGHIYTRALGIEPHQRWFSEMLASYVGYAFMRSERPDLVLVWDGVLSSLIGSPRPDHTSLYDFEQLYVRVGIPNYQWYQGIFQVRVEEVYDALGIDFVHRVREALPADAGDDLNTDALLDRLEAIHPGFHAWAKRLEVH